MEVCEWRAEGRQKPWLLANQVDTLKEILLTLTTSLHIQCSCTIIPNSFTITHHLKYIPHFHIHENAMRKELDLTRFPFIKAENMNSMPVQKKICEKTFSNLY